MSKLDEVKEIPMNGLLRELENADSVTLTPHEHHASWPIALIILGVLIVVTIALFVLWHFKLKKKFSKKFQNKAIKYVSSTNTVQSQEPAIPPPPSASLIPVMTKPTNDGATERLLYPALQYKLQPTT